ncbi:MAG: helix-turn-helix domain-containing protein [Gammaproteobacteria bacterium]|nr:MAG: helix-turn-helix domain-containing protein [Gammaproteobacteria bacterium]
MPYIIIAKSIEELQKQIYLASQVEAPAGNSLILVTDRLQTETVETVASNGETKPRKTRSRVTRALQKARTKQGLTQKDIAEKLGVSAARVSHYEVNPREIPKSRRSVVAEIYGIDPGILENV